MPLPKPGLGKNKKSAIIPEAQQQKYLQKKVEKFRGFWVLDHIGGLQRGRN